MPYESPHNIYDKGYFQGDNSKYGYTNYVEEEAISNENFKNIIQNISEKFKSGKILDVGCASGGFLSQFDEKWEKFGTDVSEYICTFAKEKKDCNIKVGDFLSVDLPQGYFDVITLLDSLDHMHNPRLALEKARFLLKKNGILIITCADSGSLFARLMGRKWYIYIPPVHLFFFSAKDLKQLLESTGFKIYKKVYPGKFVNIGLCLFRLTYILPGRFTKSLFQRLKDTKLSKLKIRINFRDIMHVYAYKK